MYLSNAVPWANGSSIALSHSMDAIRVALQKATGLLVDQVTGHDFENVACHGLDDLRHDGVAELLVGLRIGDLSLQPIVETHESLALDRHQTARVLSLLRNQDL